MDTRDSPPRNHNGDAYLLEVLALVDDLRDALRGIARGKTWARAAENIVLLRGHEIDTALKLDLAGIAQAALAVRENPKPPFKESAVAKELRLTAKRYVVALKAARAAEMEAANANGNPDLSAWVEANYAQRLAVAQRDAQPAAMTEIWFVAEKIFAAIENANKARANAGCADKPIPTGLSSDGPVIQLILAALKDTWVFSDLAAADDPDGNACDRIYRELKKRLPSLPRKNRKNRALFLERDFGVYSAT